MTTEIKNCPYCREEINLEAIKCKHCGEFLNSSERQNEVECLQNKKLGKNLPKSHNTWAFILYTILTLGLYPDIWLFKSYKVINDLSPNSKFKIHKSLPIILLVINIVSVVVSLYRWTVGSIYLGENTLENVCNQLVFCFSALLYVYCTYYGVKIIAEYVKKEKNINIKFNIYAIVFVTVIYLNFFIYTLGERIEKSQRA